MKYRIIENNDNGRIYFTIESKSIWSLFLWKTIGFYYEDYFEPYIFSSCCEAKLQIEQWKQKPSKKIVTC